MLESSEIRLGEGEAPAEPRSQVVAIPALTAPPEPRSLNHHMCESRFAVVLSQSRWHDHRVRPPTMKAKFMSPPLPPHTWSRKFAVAFEGAVAEIARMRGALCLRHPRRGIGSYDRRVAAGMGDPVTGHRVRDRHGELFNTAIEAIDPHQPRTRRPRPHHQRRRSRRRAGRGDDIRAGRMCGVPPALGTTAGTLE